MAPSSQPWADDALDESHDVPEDQCREQRTDRVRNDDEREHDYGHDVGHEEREWPDEGLLEPFRVHVGVADELRRVSGDGEPVGHREVAVEEPLSDFHRGGRHDALLDACMSHQRSAAPREEHEHDAGNREAQLSEVVNPQQAREHLYGEQFARNPGFVRTPRSRKIAPAPMASNA